MEKSLIQGRLHDFPASQSNISTLSSTFSAHASTCPIRLVKLRGTVDLQRPKRQYPKRPRRMQYLLFTFTKVNMMVTGRHADLKITNCM